MGRLKNIAPLARRFLRSPHPQPSPHPRSRHRASRRHSASSAFSAVILARGRLTRSAECAFDAALRREIQKGRLSGDPVPYEPEEIKRRGREAPGPALDGYLIGDDAGKIHKAGCQPLNL